jgi:hypothetical protein
MKKTALVHSQVPMLPATVENAESKKLTLRQRREQALDRVVTDVCRSTGTKTTEFGDHMLVQVAYGLVWPKPKDDSCEQLVKAQAAISEMSPQNATEAMLAAQMIATHDTAMCFLARATAPDQCVELIDRNVLRATRLMRLFGEQLEATQRLKGKTGQQRVTVEHVHVNAGGQAVVGAVTMARGPEGEGEK